MFKSIQIIKQHLPLSKSRKDVIHVLFHTIGFLQDLPTRLHQILVVFKLMNQKYSLHYI